MEIVNIDGTAYEVGQVPQSVKDSLLANDPMRYYWLFDKDTFNQLMAEQNEG